MVQDISMTDCSRTAGKEKKQKRKSIKYIYIARLPKQ